MAHYVILNFEDADPASSAGAITKSNLARPTGIGGAAEGTLRIYRNRASRKSKFLRKKEAVYYSCQELINRDATGNLSRDDVDQIRKDCSSAKTISIIIHGKPDDVDNGFSTSGQQVATWSQLAKLAKFLFPAGNKIYNIALIMCYGGRSENADLDHRGQIPISELRSSFAYKFFRSLCNARNIKMSARTGAVANDADVNHTVETEEQVFSVLESQRTMAKRNINKSAMDAQKNQIVGNSPSDKKKFDETLVKFANFPSLSPNNQYEQFAKDYVIYSSYVKMFVKNQFPDNLLGERTKYGKLVYEYTSGVLKIISRYDSGNGANYILYQGPLI